MGQILIGGAYAKFPALHHAFFVGDLLIKRDCWKLQELAENVRIVNMYGESALELAAFVALLINTHRNNGDSTGC